MLDKMMVSRWWYWPTAPLQDEGGDVKSENADVHFGCHAALLWQKTNLKKKKTTKAKELVPEGLTQSRAENLVSSCIHPAGFPPSPCFIPPEGLI